MVFNEEILFIHIGKTGGTSVTNYLCKVLKDPVYKVVPNRLKKHRISNEVILVGKKHATLKEARLFLKRKNINLNSFKEIFAVIRNPYSLEISLFNYYIKLIKEKPSYFDTAPKRKELILKANFKDFVKANIYHRNNISLKDYLLINNELPKNLRIIKMENLGPKFTEVGNKYGKIKEEFPHLNKSSKNSIRELITPELEKLIFDKYQWIFNNNYYQRLT